MNTGQSVVSQVAGCTDLRNAGADSKKKGPGVANRRPDSHSGTKRVWGLSLNVSRGCGGNGTMQVW